MDNYLVSEELIGYLKWLIYVAAFKDRGGVALRLQALYAKYVARLNLPQSRRWMGQLFLVLQAWYDDYKPAKRRKIGCRTTVNYVRNLCQRLGSLDVRRFR